MRYLTDINVSFYYNYYFYILYSYIPSGPAIIRWSVFSAMVEILTLALNTLVMVTSSFYLFI